jgi:hypothetical protein
VKGLRRYVNRELLYRRDSGQRRLEEISVEEVIGEAESPGARQ